MVTVIPLQHLSSQKTVKQQTVEDRITGLQAEQYFHFGKRCLPEVGFSFSVSICQEPLEEVSVPLCLQSVGLRHIFSPRATK